jgi:catechol 2,3-dioxygenase-like lactoylglutathione lyase family enzyme
MRRGWWSGSTRESRQVLRTARYGTRDLDSARRFYDAVTALLGAKRVFDMDNLSGYQGASGGMFVIGEPLDGEPTVGNGTQLVFEAPSRAAVDAAHRKALELGGTCEGPPGFRGPAERNFYAAYFRDPEGNKLMIVKQGPE